MVKGAAKKIICPYCGGTKVWRSGYMVTVSNGKQVRLKCQGCGHTFRMPTVQKRTRKTKE